MGMTLPSIDRMLAKIDRELVGIRPLPVGGSVIERQPKCWADFSSTPWQMLLDGKPELYMSMQWSTSCSFDPDPDNGLGLCDPHYQEIVG